MSDKEETLEQNFNDDELQDIMNEIENLEKEFVEEESSESSDAENGIEAQSQSSNESEDDAGHLEVEGVDDTESTFEESSEEYDVVDEAENAAKEFESNSDNDFGEEDFSEANEELIQNVVSIHESSVKSPRVNEDHNGSGILKFSGQGELEMTLTFEVNGQNADVIVGKNSLTVTMAGVDLVISEDGCSVEMQGGIQFKVPLGQNNVGRKAS